MPPFWLFSFSSPSFSQTCTYVDISENSKTPIFLEFVSYTLVVLSENCVTSKEILVDE